MLVLALTLALLQPTPGARAQADRLFTLGNQLVAEGDTAGAVAAWEGATATGWTSAAVEHNLGTVALRRGDGPRARLHLERAARLAPLDGAVGRNLALARDRVGEPPPSPVRTAWGVAVGLLRPAGFVALALALAFGALGLGMLRRPRLAGIVGAVAAVAVGAAAFAVWEATRPVGVVLVGDVPIVEAPSPTAPGVARLRAGETVRVGPEAEGWRRVGLGRAEGWVRADAVEPI